MERQNKWYQDHWCENQKDAYWAQNTKCEVDYILSTIKSYKKLKVLDIGCGTGRHSIEIARRGGDVVGIDINKELIKSAKNKIVGKSEITFINIDFNSYFSDEKFDVVLNLYDGGIGYQNNSDDNSKFIKKCFDHLKNEGVHVTSLWNKNFFKKKCPIKDWNFSNNTLTLTLLDWNDTESRIVHGGCILNSPEKISMDSFKKTANYQLYSLDEFKSICEFNSMEVINISSSFDGAAFDSNMDKDMIIFSKKMEF